ncbi:MAG: phosphate acetyltransferase [archaeon]|nr:MAG: phosphate acetyltransferase [archaeon]
MYELLKEVISRAQNLHKKYHIKIAFPEYEDSRIRNAIRILKSKRICEPVLVKPGFLHTSTTSSVALLLKGEVDAIISGSHHSSTDVLLLAFKFKDPEVKRVSGTMLMIPKKGMPLLFADVAAQPNPSSEQLAEIALLSAKNYKLITRKKPVIALLSYSTHGSGKGHRPLEIKEAVKIVKRKSDFKVDGEIQLDAALVPWISKLKNAEIEGNANVLIFPNLDSGNIGYKLLERLGEYKAVGAILQGMEKQVNDLSRGCSVEDIINLAAVTVLQVAEKK